MGCAEQARKFLPGGNRISVSRADAVRPGRLRALLHAKCQVTLRPHSFVTWRGSAVSRGLAYAAAATVCDPSMASAALDVLVA